jgi:hypothetical protein
MRRTALLLAVAALAATTRAATAPLDARQDATLDAVARAIESGPLRARCAEGLESLRRREPIKSPEDSGFAFLPLGRGRELLRLDCATEAYNRQSLFFAIDAGLPAGAAPPVLAFPRAHPPRRTDYRIFANPRDFNPESAVLYDFDKMLGDGSGGYYAEYAIDREDFVPTLRFAAEKKDADHTEYYSFERGRVPRGPHWIRYRPEPRARGCVIALADLKFDRPDDVACPAAAAALGGHEVRRDAEGGLLPWTSWNAALDREVEFYLRAPRDHGYPIFATVTFLDGTWKPTERTDTIPSTQNGMGIISYLKFYALRGGKDARVLDVARSMGDFLLAESPTPDAGKYPRFTRSTGRRGYFRQPADAGTQADRPYEIEPDKGGVAGYALVLLSDATKDPRYLAQALRNARALAANQQTGDFAHSPWPFRADYRTGEPRGPVSGDMAYILRLYDALLERGYPEFRAPRAALWAWIKHEQIPSAARDGALFAQFFEDHDTPTNRTAWAPLNLARYLLEKKDALDPDWKKDAGTLVEFVRRTFTHVEAGTTVCHEQDEDHDAWGGVNSTYGAVLALYAKAADSRPLADEARRALDFTLYAIDEKGRPRDLPAHADLGGWQEDANTDVLHNYVDALRAYPTWGEAPADGSAP